MLPRNLPWRESSDYKNSRFGIQNTSMDFFIDLRFLIPPVLNIIIFHLILKSQAVINSAAEGDVQDYATMKNVLYPIQNMPFPLFIITVLLLLLFLFTPIRIPLSLSASHTILVSSREFSVLLALLIAASVMFAPSLFWLIYFCLVISSPWFTMLWNLFNWFRHVLRSIPPASFIIYLNHNQEDVQEPAAAYPQVELNTV